jgi:hypothetical protein
MNQVGHEALQNLAGTGIGSHRPIQGFRLCALGGDQASTGASGGAGNQQAVIDSGVENPHQAKHAECLSKSLHQASNSPSEK